jgi:hypothetical protein
LKNPQSGWAAGYLPPGRRTVDSAPLDRGFSGRRNNARYHHVLNQLAWYSVKLALAEKDKTGHAGGSITDRQHRIGTFYRRH